MEIGSSLQGAYAARQCPVRLFRERDPFETAEPAPPDDALQTLFDEGRAFETEIVDQLADLHGSDLVQIPGRDDESGKRRAALRAAALRDGVRHVFSVRRHRRHVGADPRDGRTLSEQRCAFASTCAHRSRRWSTSTKHPSVER